MEQINPSTMQIDRSGTFEKVPDRRGALIRLSILLGLWGWMFWPEIAQTMRLALGQSDTVHLAVLPVAVLLVLLGRRKEYLESLDHGSVWGVVIAAGGLLFFASMLWPFSFGYFRLMSLGVVLMGLVAAASGMAMLRRCLPILVLLVLAVPVGQRLYASLIIRPETYTVRATAGLLNYLPGLKTTVRGKDILYTRSDRNGAVALGESNRGARLLVSFAFLGVWVAVYRHRSRWRLLFVAIAGVGIILVCNLLRLLSWGVVQVYMWPDPVSLWPRQISAVVSLAAAYALFAAACTIRVRLFVEEEGPDDPAEAGKDGGHVSPKNSSRA
jgi:exosortase/archaeosortase family protein